MANGRFRLNAAAFVNDYQDLQVQSFPTVGVIDISNAASATINGIELEAAAAPGYGLQLAGHVAWLEARYDRYLAKLPGGSLLDAQDHRLNNAPRWSGRAAVVYDRRIRRASTFSVSADVSWQSRVFFTPANDQIETQRPYSLVHLRAGIHSPTRRWELAVFIRNVLHQQYITGTANVPLSAITGHPGEPRHWGTQLTLRP